MDSFALVTALLLVGLNAFFVATEFAIVKVRPTRIEELLQTDLPGAHHVRHVVGRLDGYLSATQLGITITSLGLGWLGEPAFARLLAPLFGFADLIDPTLQHQISLLASFAMITFLHIVLGELLPKSIAIRRAEAVTLAIAMPMRFFYLCFFPLIWFLQRISNGILKLLQIETNGQGEGHSEEEIRLILNQARSAGLLSGQRSEILRKIMTLGSKTARHLMVPRNEVVVLDVNAPLAENLEKAKASGHTQFPLCDRELDDAVGVIDIRQVLFAVQPDQNIDLRSFASPVAYFPELMGAEQLLPAFRQRRVTLAIVVDEYGGASGILTPADVLGAVLGDLVEQNDLIALPGGAFDVEGITPLEEIENRFNIALPTDGMRTIAGFIMERLGRMPRVSDRVIEAGYGFFVMELQGPKIKRIRIQRDPLLLRKPASSEPSKTLPLGGFRELTPSKSTPELGQS